MTVSLSTATRLREKGWETPYLKRWTGTLQEFWDKEGLKLPVVKAPEVYLNEVHHDLDFGTIGLGTYRWKYDPLVISLAVDIGANFIDTAEGYGYGRAEETLGRMRLGKVVVATKVGRQHMSKESVINAADRSLQRLKRETIDLYQTHWPSPRYPMEETIEAFDTLWKAGKIRYAGLSNSTIYYFQEFQRLASVPLISLQVRLNKREPEKAELISLLKSKGIKLIAYSPLGQDFREFRKETGLTAKAAVDWVAAMGALPIPQTNNGDHLRELFGEDL